MKKNRSSFSRGPLPTEDNVFLTTASAFMNLAQRSSVWPLQFGLACCAIEMIAVGCARYDIARFGSEVFRASPRQADLMIVAGTITNKMVPVLKKIYDQMSEPKWVIAMGACAGSGGIFDTYSVCQRVDHVIPVDVYVPGCPPRPESLLYALMKLQEKIDKDSVLKRK